ARAPDFIVVSEGRHPGIGNLGQLPREISDVVFSRPEFFPVVVVDITRGRRIEVNDVYAMRVVVLQARGEGLIAEPIFAVELERHERGWDRRGIGGARHAARGFAESKLGGEKADDVEPELRV